jgi:hypothetical protein
MIGYGRNTADTNNRRPSEILSEIDEFKGAWRALGTAPERLNALRLNLAVKTAIPPC